MGFSNSDSSGPSYMSFLSRYSNNGATTASQGSTASRVLPKGNPAPSNMKPPAPTKTERTNTGASSASMGSQQSSTANSMSSARSNEVSSASKPNPTTTLKRKAEDELVRPGRVGETSRNNISSTTTKATAFSTNTKPTAVASKPSLKPSDSAKPVDAPPTKVPKKGSYLDILQRAKTNAATIKAPIGAIVNKPRPPPEKKEKEWQKKFAEERAAKARGDRISKSPGLVANGDKSSAKAANDKGGPGRKAGIDGAPSSKKPVPERKSSTPGTSALNSKSSRPDIKSRPAAGASRKEEMAAPKRGKGVVEPPPRRSSTYDRDREKDRTRPGIGGKRYVYREDSYDSDSDMEAAGIDILEEEERSSKVARIEDAEQEKLEKRLAAEKAARKRGLR